MVGRLGARASAAVSTTTTINWFIHSFPYAIGVAVLALVSREYGAKREGEAKKIVGSSFYLSLIFGGLITIISLLIAPYIPIWMNAEKAIRKDASAYFFIISLSILFQTLDIVFSAAIRAVKNTKTPMYINLFCNILNVILNYIFIYILSLGVRGAAMASAISYSISGIMMVIFAYKQKFIRWSIEDMRADKDVLLKIFNIAFPTALNTGASCFGYVVFAGLVSSMGAVVFAAHSIAVTEEELFYIPGYGLRTASSSLIGNAIGEGNIKKTHNGRDEYFLYNFYYAGNWCVVIFSGDTYNVHF